MGTQNLLIDQHMQSVLEFMQSTIPSSKLIAVSENLPKMARLLWEGYPQEPIAVALMVESKLDSPSQSQEASI